MKITTREAANLHPLVADAATKTTQLETDLTGFVAPGPHDAGTTLSELRISLEAVLNALPTESSSGTGASSIPIAGAEEFRQRVEDGYDEE